MPPVLSTALPPIPDTVVFNVFALLTPYQLAKCSCVSKSWHAAVRAAGRTLWPRHVRELVHDANTWIRATRYNGALLFEGDDIQQFLGGMGPPPQLFLSALPAYAVAQTHVCMRDSRALKRCAPLDEAVEAALFTPDDLEAEHWFYGSSDDGHAAFVEGCGVLAPDNPGSSWVLWAVDAFEAVASLLCNGAVSATQPVPSRLFSEDSTDFATADANAARQQPLRSWLEEHAHHFGAARVSALLARCVPSAPAVDE